MPLRLNKVIGEKIMLSVPIFNVLIELVYLLPESSISLLVIVSRPPVIVRVPLALSKPALKCL
jgi:hypothetical protein